MVGEGGIGRAAVGGKLWVPRPSKITFKNFATGLNKKFPQKSELIILKNL